MNKIYENETFRNYVFHDGEFIGGIDIFMIFCSELRNFWSISQMVRNLRNVFCPLKCDVCVFCDYLLHIWGDGIRCAVCEYCRPILSPQMWKLRNLFYPLKCEICLIRLRFWYSTTPKIWKLRNYSITKMWNLPDPSVILVFHDKVEHFRRLKREGSPTWQNYKAEGSIRWHK